jgi:RHS repeat-associated protein
VRLNLNVGYPSPGSTGDALRHRFTGKERDAATGLDYFGARYYASMQGRFTSPDEFTGGLVDPQTGRQVQRPGPLPYADIRYPQSLNKYAYVMNNPLRWTDPDGHCLELFSCTAEGATIGSFVGPAGTAAGAVVGALVGATILYFATEAVVDAVMTHQAEDLQAKQSQPPGSRGGENTSAKPAEPSGAQQDSSGKRASDSAKGERHGDGGRQLSKGEKQIKALEEQLKGASRAEADRIRVKIRHIKETGEKAKKGETHWR